MRKKIAKLKTIKVVDNIIVRGSGPMIEGFDIRRMKIMPDERGRLGEIMRADDPWFKKFGQVYFTTTYPSVVKAWHYHKKQTDHFAVIKGMVKIALCDQRKQSPTFGVINEVNIGRDCPAMLKIPPEVCHGWMCISQTEAYIINVVSEMYDYSNPDEFRTDPHDNDIPYDWKRKDG